MYLLALVMVIKENGLLGVFFTSVILFDCIPSNILQVTMQLKAPPKWLRKPCGASFGFGGKLVTVEQVFVFVSMPLSGSLFVFAGTWVPPVPVPEHCGDGASPGGGQC